LFYYVLALQPFYTKRKIDMAEAAFPWAASVYDGRNAHGKRK